MKVLSKYKNVDSHTSDEPNVRMTRYISGSKAISGQNKFLIFDQVTF